MLRVFEDFFRVRQGYYSYIMGLQRNINRSIQLLIMWIWLK